MAVAVFNPALFAAMFPEFSAVSTGALQGLFYRAGLYLNNTDCSIVQDVNKRLILLNMLVAHLAFIGGLLTADGQPRPVGRVSGASEGAVSAEFADVTPTPGTGAFFAQSQYGAEFWQATTAYRGMQYIPQPTRVEGFTGTPLGSGWVIP